MARFYFYPKNTLTVVNNVPHREDFSIDASDGYLMINVFTENSEGDGYTPPLFAVIAVKSVEVFGKLQLIDWGNGNYEVICTSEKYYLYRTPTAIAQNSYPTGAETYVVTLFRDNSLHLLCECDDMTSNFDINYDLREAKILFQPTSHGFLIILSADTARGKYLALILFDGKFTKLFETEADNIEYSERSFTVTENCNDMLLRTKKTEYAFRNASLQTVNQTFSYGRTDDYPTELIPYLFLEALQANDTCAMKESVDDSLLPSINSFKDYFGDFERIVCPKYRNYQSKNDLLEVALLYPLNRALNTPKYYKFQIENGKITNVTD